MKKILKLSLNEMAERLQAVSDFELMDMIGGASPGDCYYEAISYYLRDRGYSNSVDAAWVAQDFGDKMYPPGGVWTEQYGTLTYIDQQTWVQDGPHSEKEYMNYLGNYFKYTEYSSDAIKGGQIDINSNNFMVTFATGNTYNGSQGEFH